MRRPLILIGGGGHCKSVIEVAEGVGYSILGILDRPGEVGKNVLNYEVIGVDNDIPKYVDKAEFIITVGFIKNPALRISLYNKVLQVGGKLATMVASTAHVSKYASLGVGTVVMHHACVNAGAVIGNNVIINTFADIEHDARIGNHCHISTGAIINGDVVIGDNTFIGSQSVVNQSVNISEGIVSSLSVVNKDITQKGVYAGSPVEFIREL